MDSIGNILRCERLRQGLRLEQVAEWTKIGQPFLEAMEANRFDRLPAGLLTRSFILQYARTLNLDYEQLIASFKEHFEEPVLPMPTPLPMKVPMKASVLPTISWLIVAVVFGGGVSNLWENARQSSPDAKTSRMDVAQARSGVDALVENRSQIKVPAHAEGRPNVLTEHTGRNLSPGTLGVMRVAFSATEPVWISIDSDGNHVYSGTLAGQERKELEASDKMIALIGNAGGLEVQLNGKPIGSLGQHGQVRWLELNSTGAHLVNRSLSVTPVDRITAGSQAP
jgi:cytoskeleton protein RodZ